MAAKKSSVKKVKEEKSEVVKEIKYTELLVKKDRLEERLAQGWQFVEEYSYDMVLCKKAI